MAKMIGLSIGANNQSKLNQFVRFMIQALDLLQGDKYSKLSVCIMY